MIVGFAATVFVMTLAICAFILYANGMDVAGAEDIPVSPIFIGGTVITIGLLVSDWVHLNW